MGSDSDWLGPASSAAKSACSQLDYTNTVAGAAATTPSAFRHHRRRRRRASGGSGDSDIQTPMPSPSPSPLRQRLRQQRVNANRPRPVLLSFRAGSGTGGTRFGSGGAQFGWGRHQLQPSLPSHSLLYIYTALLQTLLTEAGSFFIHQILIHWFHCRFIVIVIVGIVIVGSLLL